MKKISLIIFSLLISLLLMACTASESTIIITGTIVEVLIDDEGQPATLLVEAEISEDNSYRRVYVTIQEEPQIYNSLGEPMTIDALKKGKSIKITFDEILVESHPILGSAKTIELSYVPLLSS